MEATEKKPNAIARARQFMTETWVELRQKTSWPTQKEVQGTTVVVIVAVLFCALYLYVVDYAIVSGLTFVESSLAGLGR